MIPPDERRHKRSFSWDDRRKWNESRMKVVLVFAMLLYFASLGIASNKVDTGAESLQEHSSAIIGVEGWIIGGLILLAQGLIVYIFINAQGESRRGRTDLKSDMKQGHDELKAQLTEFKTDITKSIESKQDIHACDKLREACRNYKPMGE